MDKTEGFRRNAVADINSRVESDDEVAERSRLEGIYEGVWNTEEATELFEFTGFMAPYVVVKRKSDGVKGTLEFQHMPRFYFKFIGYC